jgi:hypothetical protein
VQRRRQFVTGRDVHHRHRNQGPGQQDRIRIVDVDGELLIIDAATWPELPADLEAELLTVLDSMRFALRP